MYLAKSIKGEKGSYEYHVESCVKVMQDQIDFLANNIEKLLSNQNITKKEFKDEMIKAMWVHDVGKLNSQFQNVLIKSLNGETVGREEHFRHEILSYMYAERSDIFESSSDMFPYYLIAILGHHKRLDFDFSKFDRDKKKKTWPKLSSEAIRYLNENLGVQNIRFKEVDVEKIKRGLFAYIIPQKLKKRKYLEEGQDIYKIRLLFAIIQGCLCYCDWLGSSNKDVKRITLTQEEFISKLKAKVEADNRKFEQRPFHQKCSSSEGNILAIAPTGAGKTEASLLWALKDKCNRIIFLMPTMVTSNSIYERLSSVYFDNDLCGLTHSGANTYFSLSEDEVDKFKLLQNKAFIPKIMTSTVDQILSSGFNTGYWQFKEFALVGSHVIFDEIQAYDSYTIALITKTIEKIKLLGGKIMIMSATMPKFLREHFSELLDVQSPIIADELMDRTLNDWQYLDKSVDELDDEIKCALDGGKKVALIVNDVQTAKEQYIKWKDYANTMCLHSQFSMKDRSKKEDVLLHKNDIQLVIGTQVLEVSLDISFEVMFSECAAMDSLIQRAGRCNRHKEYTNSKFIVFNYSQVGEMIYTKDVLEKTKEALVSNQGRLTERQISNMLEDVYEDYQLKNEDYEKGIKEYDRLQHDYFIFDIPLSEENLKTRLFEQAKTSIIPFCYYEKVMEHCEKREFEFIKLYEVPVSYKWYKWQQGKTLVKNKFDLPIFDIEYNYEYGIEKEVEDKGFFIE